MTAKTILISGAGIGGPTLAFWLQAAGFEPTFAGRPRQRAEMIVHVTGGKALAKEIADQIIDRTDGVPLFMEELDRSTQWRRRNR